MTPLLISFGIWAHLMFAVALPPGKLPVEVDPARFAIMGMLLLGMIYFWVSLAVWVLQ
jgi:uncharacterized membrane-anchored protein